MSFQPSEAWIVLFRCQRPRLRTYEDKSPGHSEHNWRKIADDRFDTPPLERGRSHYGLFLAM
jgi:hypothetical protein